MAACARLIRGRGLKPKVLQRLMRLDKKPEHGKLNIGLPARMGNMRTVSNCEYADIRGAIFGNAT